MYDAGRGTFISGLFPGMVFMRGFTGLSWFVIRANDIRTNLHDRRKMVLPIANRIRSTGAEWVFYAVFSCRDS